MSVYRVNRGYNNGAIWRIQEAEKLKAEQVKAENVERMYREALSKDSFKELSSKKVSNEVKSGVDYKSSVLTIVPVEINVRYENLPAGWDMFERISGNTWKKSSKPMPIPCKTIPCKEKESDPIEERRNFHIELIGEDTWHKHFGNYQIPENDYEPNDTENEEDITEEEETEETPLKQWLEIQTLKPKENTNANWKSDWIWNCK